MLARRTPSIALALFFATSLVALGCGSSSSSGDGVLHGGGGDDASVVPEASPFDPNEAGLQGVDAPGNTPVDASPEAFFVNDPPPMMCGAETGVTPPVPGGTPECPDDKNLQGCPCTTEGQTAACWPGYRKNRNRGICKDGTTTCVKNGEVGLAWGPCNGYVLPVDGVTTGKDACVCFSGGTWKIDNLEPVFFGSGSTISGAISSIPQYDAAGNLTGVTVPTSFSSAPTTAWSHSTLTTDCGGHFKLCYTLKAGDVKNPQPTDCVVTQVCAEGDYTTPNQPQKWPDLPGWISNDAACASQFNSTGGYGEMSVSGTSIECQGVDKVFNRVGYCPSSCNTNPSDPACAGCSNGGSGSF